MENSQLSVDIESLLQERYSTNTYFLAFRESFTESLNKLDKTVLDDDKEEYEKLIKEMIKLLFVFQITAKSINQIAESRGLQKYIDKEWKNFESFLNSESE